MRNIFLTLLLSVLVLAQTFPLAKIDMGISGTAVGNLDQSMNAAVNRVAYGVMKPASATASKFSFYANSVNGTLDSDDIRVDLVKGIIGAPSNAVTFTAGATDTANLTPNPMSNGDTVTFFTTGTLPSGLTADTVYYVCSTSATSFKIDDNADCLSNVDLSDTGTGTHMVYNYVSSSTTATSTPTGAAWVEVTGLSGTLAANAQYFYVVRNNATSPTTNYFSIRRIQFAVSLNVGANAAGGSPFASTHSTTGTSWTGMNGVSGGWLVEYSGPAYDGIPVYADASAGTSDRAHGTQEVGVRFTMPGGGTWKVRALSLAFLRTGNPTALPRIRIYTGANGAETLAATATAGSYSSTSTPIQATYYLASDLSIAGGTVVRIVLGTTNADGSSSNGYTPNEVTILDTATAKTLMHGAQHAKFDGTSTWTYTDTKYIPFSMWLSVTEPNVACAGGAGGGTCTFVQ